MIISFLLYVQSCLGIPYKMRITKHYLLIQVLHKFLQTRPHCQ
nr:MAG TPA: hypothetical protein [Caudoviricetes sp.]